MNQNIKTNAGETGKPEAGYGMLDEIVVKVSRKTDSASAVDEQKKQHEERLKLVVAGMFECKHRIIMLTDILDSCNVCIETYESDVMPDFAFMLLGSEKGLSDAYDALKVAIDDTDTLNAFLKTECAMVLAEIMCDNSERGFSDFSDRLDKWVDELNEKLEESIPYSVDIEDNHNEILEAVKITCSLFIKNIREKENASGT